MNIDKLLRDIDAMVPNRMDIRFFDKYGEPYRGTGDMMVKITCDDCIEKYRVEEEIIKNSESKIAELLKMQNGSCKKNIVAHTKLEELYDILLEMEAGFISINSYEEGTQIEFMVKEGGYNKDNFIEVCTPGVAKEVLEVDKEYYICFTKYGGNKKMFEKKRLKKIELKYDNSYDLIFDGLKDPVTTLTRGHIRERQKLLNRIDHVVISQDKGAFISKSIQQIGIESMLNKEGSKKLLNKFIKEM